MTRPTPQGLFPGDKFEDLTIVEYLGRMVPPGWTNPTKYHVYRAVCSCGEERIAHQGYFTNERNAPHQCRECTEERTRKYQHEYQLEKRRAERIARGETILTQADVLRMWKRPEAA